MILRKNFYIILIIVVNLINHYISSVQIPIENKSMIPILVFVWQNLAAYESDSEAYLARIYLAPNQINEITMDEVPGKLPLLITFHNSEYDKKQKVWFYVPDGNRKIFIYSPINIRLELKN